MKTVLQVLIDKLEQHAFRLLCLRVMNSLTEFDTNYEYIRQ